MPMGGTNMGRIAAALIVGMCWDPVIISIQTILDGKINALYFIIISSVCAL